MQVMLVNQPLSRKNIPILIDKFMNRYIKLLREAYQKEAQIPFRDNQKEEKILEPAHIPTKLARKNKPSSLSLNKHRKYGGHCSSGSHNPQIKEAMKREAETNVKHDKSKIKDPKSSIRELFKR